GLAMLGGASFLPALERLRARLGAPLFAVLFSVIFLVPPALFLRGYLIDPMRAQADALRPAPGETAMYAFLRDSTDRDCVVIDHRSRDLVLVLGQRRLLAGTVFNTERAGFPADDLAARRALTADLFGPVATAREDLDRLADVVRNARRVHAVSDVHVIYRAGDFAPGDEPWLRLEAAMGEAAEKRWDRDGFRIYLLRLTPR
ncbi:MAG: hypothetical protein IT348_07725, partial [Candidatus Eisenbacteria bacterium]|nr:hypothetical protein [Candidatus Eisenbacteria bacterium]